MGMTTHLDVMLSRLLLVSEQLGTIQRALSGDKLSLMVQVNEHPQSAEEKALMIDQVLQVVEEDLNGLLERVA